MLLTTDPEPPHDAPMRPSGRLQQPVSLRERLFGDRSLVVLGVLVLAAAFQLALFLRDGEAAQDFTRALIFVALAFSGARDRAVQAGVVGLSAGMLWVVADVGLAVVAVAGVVTALVEYASTEITTDLEASAATQPRSELQARIRASAALQVAAAVAFATPIALAAHRFLADGGVAGMQTPLILVAGGIYLVVSTYRRLRDFTGSFVGQPAAGGER
jgi:hypothetical protein